MLRTVHLAPLLVFGVVSFIQTTSVDPNRRATARGIRSEDELHRAQPQMFELFTTEWTVLHIDRT
jgi:hypothetical protein